MAEAPKYVITAVLRLPTVAAAAAVQSRSAGRSAVAARACSDSVNPNERDFRHLISDLLAAFRRTAERRASSSGNEFRARRRDDGHFSRIRRRRGGPTARPHAGCPCRRDMIILGRDDANRAKLSTDARRRAIRRPFLSLATKLIGSKASSHVAGFPQRHESSCTPGCH